MNRHIPPILASAMAFSGCARISDDEAKLLGMAGSIQRYPVQRSELIKTFGLEGVQSERISGGIRSGHLRFSETWRHPSGLTVSAFDSVPVGRDWVITREFIDAILNDRERRSTDFVSGPGGDSPRDAFHGFSISKGHKVLYRSETDRDQPGSGE